MLLCLHIIDIDENNKNNLPKKMAFIYVISYISATVKYFKLCAKY